MRILHIIDTLYMGGAENVLIGLASGQKQLGHEVTIMPLICPEMTPVRGKMEANGLAVMPFMVNGSYYNPTLILKIAKVIKQFDIVHVHLCPAFYWTAFAKIISFSKVPLVYTEHSTNNRRRNSAFFHYLDNQIYQHSYKMIVACAEKVLETYRAAFPKVKHTCFINNGIDTMMFSNAEPYTKKELLGVDENVFVVTMVARFMTMKRQDTIVEAISKLPKNIHAVFVGGNPKDEGLLRIKELAVEKKVSNKVHFLYIRNDVPRILKTSDVVIMASDYEGLSLSSIEGMAAGKPFIASDVNGLREVVGGAGLIFENGNSDELSSLLNKLSTNKVFYDEVAQKCLERSVEYDVHKMVGSYLSIYKKVLE